VTNDDKSTLYDFLDVILRILLLLLGDDGDDDIDSDDDDDTDEVFDKRLSALLPFPCR